MSFIVSIFGSLAKFDRVIAFVGTQMRLSFRMRLLNNHVIERLGKKLPIMGVGCRRDDC